MVTVERRELTKLKTEKDAHYFLIPTEWFWTPKSVSTRQKLVGKWAVFSFITTRRRSYKLCVTTAVC